MTINIVLKFKEEISSLLPLKKQPKVAVAVSGGSDSLALAILLNKILQESGGELFCITIDHGLRENSAIEAIKVKKLLKRHNIKQEIISWIGEKPKANLQEEARVIRYKLLTDYCHQHGIVYLATGHQQNDQAENFLIRADHGSGVYGLAGIPRLTEFNNIKIIRPLLEFNKDELQEFLRNENIEWIEDPSNQNERFTRVKFRKLLNQYPEWISKLSNISRNLSKAKDCIEYMLTKAMKELVEFNQDGKVSIDLAAFNQLPQEIRFRILAKTLQDIGLDKKMARGERIERLIAKIAAGKEFKKSTLAKCLISRKKNLIIIEPEKPCRDVL